MKFSPSDSSVRSCCWFLQRFSSILLKTPETRVWGTGLVWTLMQKCVHALQEGLKMPTSDVDNDQNASCVLQAFKTTQGTDCNVATSSSLLSVSIHLKNEIYIIYLAAVFRFFFFFLFHNLQIQTWSLRCFLTGHLHVAQHPRPRTLPCWLSRPRCDEGVFGCRHVWIQLEFSHGCRFPEIRGEESRQLQEQNTSLQFYQQTLTFNILQQ